MASWELSQHLLIDTGKPRKTFVEVAGRRSFRVLGPRSETQALQLPVATPWTQGIVPLVSNLMTKRRELQLRTLGALRRAEELPVPLGGHQSPSGRFGELSLASTGFRTPDHPAPSHMTARFA